MTLVLAAVTAAQLALAAQARPASPSPAPSQPGAGTAQIAGTVRNAADGKPLARARVLAVSPDLPEPRVTLSGADGKYTSADLPAGAYTLTATRSGFAPLTYGQARTITGTPVTVTSGQHVGSIDFPLVPGGVIVGRILDEDGAPFAGATVDALVARAQNGNDMLFSVATAQTDDRGEFRLFGLAPGAYYVSAADPAFAAISTPKGVQHYSPTYYPGTPQADQARTVTVGGAGAPPRVEFKIELVPPARISGTLVPYDAKQLLNGAIILSPLEGEGLPMVAPEEPQLLPNGRFVFDGVAPGHYQIRARGQTDAAAAALFAVYSIEVFGEDVDGINMTLRPGAVLDGVVLVESHGAAKPELTALRVRAPFVDGNAFGDSLTGSVQANGSYTLRGIMKGDHQIVVDGLTPPWVLQSVRYRGSDVTDVRLPVDEREQLHDVRIVISDTAASVSGTVENARRVPIPHTGVLVGATTPALWLRTSRRMRVTYTDENGRWTVTGLPPGDYFAVAAPFIDENDLGRHDRLEALQARGTPFRIDADGASPTLTLTFNPLQAVAVR
jgi:protocatechuate 3,4-dioxygenase beta subunit